MHRAECTARHGKSERRRDKIGVQPLGIFLVVIPQFTCTSYSLDFILYIWTYPDDAQQLVTQLRCSVRLTTARPLTTVRHKLKHAILITHLHSSLTRSDSVAACHPIRHFDITYFSLPIPALFLIRILRLRGAPACVPKRAGWHDRHAHTLLCVK